MKMSIFGMLFILVALTVGPLIYFNGGAAYIDDFFAGSSSPKSAAPKLNKDVVYAPVTTDRKVKVYKWKDENGLWQFGNMPPQGQTSVETMVLKPDMNIMKSVGVPEDEVENTGRSGVVSLGHNQSDSKTKGQRDNDGVGISQESLDNPYAPESISELFNSSKNIQNLLNSRQQQQISQQPK